MAVTYSLATRALPPGNGTTDATTGQQRIAGTGRPTPYTATLVNESGTPITHFKVALLGWMIAKFGITDCGNDVPVTGYIEYGSSRTNFTGIALNAAANATAEFALAVPIPVGASFVFNLTSNVAVGQYRLINNGFVGLLTKADTAAVKKERLFYTGDSIMNGADAKFLGYTASQGRCPAIQMAVNGSRAYSYVPLFSRFVALATLLGITRFVSNWGTNGFGYGQTYDNILLDLYAMRDMARAAGIKFTQCTMTPSADLMMVRATALYSSDYELTVVVPNTALFSVDNLVRITGADQTEYNISSIVNQIVNGTTFKMFFGGSPVPQATGFIYVQSPGWREAKLTVPRLPNYAAGSNSNRALFNVAVRSRFDGYVEWADAVEDRRDSGYWAGQGEGPFFPATRLVTVMDGSPRSTTQFKSTYDLPPGSTGNGAGRLFGITGLNIGMGRVMVNNTEGGYLSFSSLPYVPEVGDTFKVMASGASPTADGGHPANGAQDAMIESLRNTIDVWLT